MTGPLQSLGDPNAVVCEDGVCLIPGATPDDSYSGSVISATTASTAATSASASTNAL